MESRKQTTAPTEPGWYYAVSDQEIRIVKVVDRSFGYGVLHLGVYLDGVDRTFDIHEMKKWFGPVPMIQEI